MKNYQTCKELITAGGPGPVVQSVASPTADPGVVSLARPSRILSWRLIMKKFYDHSPPSADSRRAVVELQAKVCALA